MQICFSANWMILCLTLEILKIEHVYYVVGDINVDITASRQFVTAQRRINLFSSNFFIPIITKSTRVTNTSSTITDRIITNNMSHRISPIIIKTDLSDHYLIATRVLHNQFLNKIKSTKTFRRDLTNFSSDIYL